MALSEKERSLLFASKRAQAQRNAADHVANILWKTAESIVKATRKYRPYYQSKTMSNVAQYEKEARQIAANAEKAIEKYVEAYSQAGGRVLKIDTKELVSNYLKQEVFGKTYMQRNSEYLSDFSEDIVKLVKAGVSLRYDERKIINAVRSSYKDPYNRSLITKEAKKNSKVLEVPHRGKGIFSASYGNVIRNAQNTINLVWGKIEMEYGKRNKAIGFRSFRGSSYPCDQCDYEASYIHTFRDPYPPYHAHCVCYTKFIFDKEELEND